MRERGEKRCHTYQKKVNKAQYSVNKKCVSRQIQLLSYHLRVYKQRKAASQVETQN